ncbi:hypothetical protein [Brevibacillus sp. Leaf182]|uniref:hypothetical protein n=1 Tax=Brevibacillus sp. Leaf182 TaxID=1736290 RepID=UPI0006FBFCBE|nr:hypothetical protein [Brevibacillus sp. Leaf182]RAT97432.1 hypothetical protein ASG16_012640 [Brevibacillus sp. Leaf182]
MRKKWLGIGLSVGITGALIWGYGASASADSTTMGVYESALHQTKEAKNMTAHAQLSLTDNGAKLLTLEGVAKIDHNQHIGNVEATFTDTLGEKSMQAFLEKDQVVVKKGDSNVYRVMEKMDRRHQPENDADNKRGAMMHKLFASVFGDLGKNATVENLPDGGKRTSLQLSEEQIPAFIQAAGPILYDKLAEHSQEASSSENHLSVKLPRLQEDFQVDQVLLNAKIDEKNQIEQQSAVVNLSGTDASGKEHKLQLSLDIRLTDLGTTTPDRIDLTGKQVEKVSREDMKNKWGKGWTKHSDSE